MGEEPRRRCPGARARDEIGMSRMTRPRGFLSAVLERVESKDGEGGRIVGLAERKRCRILSRSLGVCMVAGGKYGCVGLESLCPLCPLLPVACGLGARRGASDGVCCSACEDLRVEEVFCGFKCARVQICHGVARAEWAKRRCARMGPPSILAVTICMVVPVFFGPDARAWATRVLTRKFGQERGWILRMAQARVLAKTRR